MSETRQEGIMRIGKLLDKSITLTGKDVGGNGRFTQGPYDPAAEERARIIDIINKRIDTHSGFVNLCMDREIEPSAGIFSALTELRSLLREIEK
jgi:hypothetical protein